MPKIITPKDSFHEKYKKSHNGCWEWCAAKNENGYGIIGIGNGKITKAHRFSYILSNGEIPKGIYVCHKCDNPSCVNPKHLFLGTAKDNHVDMVKKGRGSAPPIHYGENHHMAKINISDAKNIRNLANNKNLSQRKLSKIFGISQTTIGKIINNKLWKCKK